MFRAPTDFLDDSLKKRKSERTVIESTSEPPLTIFGEVVPNVIESKFNLPWYTTASNLAIEKAKRRSKTRRARR